MATKVSEAARKWAESQGLSIDDPKVIKYAQSIGSHHPRSQSSEEEEDLMEIAETEDRDFQEGMRYRHANDADLWKDEDPRFIEAVKHYAESQGVDLDDERVIKYARGLKGRTGDFGGREQDSPVGQRQ